MELAPDDDMNGLLGIVPVNATAERLPPALAGPAVTAATTQARASDERRRNMAEDFDDAATMSCAATADPVPTSAPEWSTETGSAPGALHRRRRYCSPTGSVTAWDW